MSESLRDMLAEDKRAALDLLPPIEAPTGQRRGPGGHRSRTLPLDSGGSHLRKGKVLPARAARSV